MRTLPIATDFSHQPSAPAGYVVRLWTLPPAPFSAWAVDDWDITDATSIAEVLAWAELRAGADPFEIFVRFPGSDGLVRLHGNQPDAEQELQIPLREP